MNFITIRLTRLGPLRSLRGAVGRLAGGAGVGPRAAAAVAAVAWAALVAGTLNPLPAAAAYVLAPQYAGSFAAGTGATAQFHRIANDWQGSAVLWDDANRQFGSGARVSTFTWGTGLWGQADWLAVQQAAAGAPSAASGALVQSFSGVLGSINHGNSRYNECYSSTWGAAALVPFFSPAAPLGECTDAEAGEATQQNWTARYSGFIRITDPGEYNFSVLNDDGFFLRLVGAGGAELDIGRDFLNPRERIGFDQNLVLGQGLYGFELGAWNRLGAGVVDLRWTTAACAAGCNWTLVPTENLLGVGQVSAPPSLSLVLLAGLLGWAHGGWRTRLRTRPSRCLRSSR